MNGKRTVQFASIAVIVLFLISNIISYLHSETDSSMAKYSVNLANSIEAYANETIEFKATIKPTKSPPRPFWEFNVDGKKEAREGVHLWEYLENGEKHSMGLWWLDTNYTWEDPSIYRTFYTFNKEGVYRVHFYLNDKDRITNHQSIKVVIIKPDLTFSFKPVKGQFRIGEDIFVNATIDNQGRFPIPVLKPDGFHANLSVSSENRTDLKPPTQGQGQGIGAFQDYGETVIVQPHSSYTMTYDITGWFLFNETGRYSITGYYDDVYQGGWSIRQYWQGRLNSTEAFFDIIPK